MRCLVQRVRSASVVVADETVGEIQQGLLVYVGFAPEDVEADLAWMLKKLLHLRVFSDGQDRMNLSVQDISGQILLVSQFTLYGDCSRGNRPSFTQAMAPDRARILFARFVEIAQQSSVPIQSGIFAADMQVFSQNDGPVTLILNSKKQ